MNENPGPLDAYKAYLQCQLSRTGARKNEPGHPFVTISRQAGAGGITIGRLLNDYLRRRGKTDCTCPWTVFDKNLIAETIRTCGLPEGVEPYMSEEKIAEIDDLLQELFNLHPAQWTLVRKTSQTILRLAQMGRVILVGRGANVVTRGLAGGFHVRLIGSIGKRLQHLERYYGFKRTQAADFMKSEDDGRQKYFKAYFGKDIDDPLLYDLVINTDYLSYEEAAHIIGRAVLARHPKEKARNGTGSRADDGA